MLTHPESCPSHRIPEKVEKVKECEGEGSWERARDESKDTLRKKETGCADLFDIFFFQSKITIVREIGNEFFD